MLHAAQNIVEILPPEEVGKCVVTPGHHLFGGELGDLAVALKNNQILYHEGPPPEPASAIQVSKTGQVRYSALVVEPGQTTSVNVTSGQDVLQLVSEVPISRAMHMCRHADGGCPTAP